MVFADRNLLFGILALQMEFVTRDALIAAMNAWVLNKAQSLGDILMHQGSMAQDERLVLDSLVEKHLARHGGDPECSLLAVPTDPETRKALESVPDFDVQASLAKAGEARTPGDRPLDTWNETCDIGATTAQGASGSDGRFRLLRLHDRGGLGEVFVALDRELNREVALKLMQERHSGDPQLRARFVVEAEVTGGLEHPGIVPVYGLGAYPDGRPFYAMRFIRGDNLKSAVERFHSDPELLKNQGARTLERRRLLGRFLDVCNAISYAHSRGVLHRDLKPGNIMLGKYGETLVVDWGLAKSVRRVETALDLSEHTLAPGSGSDLQPTEIGARIGTPAFMSPEQAAGQLDHLGPSSDVYSLGATLYFVLTGKPPFQGSDLVELLRQVERNDYPPPSQVNPRVDRALDAICRKAMALDPTDRYPTVRGLAEEIEHWLADEPVSAWREPKRRRVERWVRRHKPLVTGLASLVIVGLFALATGTILLGQANRRVQVQRDLARRQRDLANDNFQKARDAVDLFLTRVSEEHLLNQPGFEPMREKLLRPALAYYQDFVRERSDDPALRLQLADAYRRLGEINGELGDLKGAIAALEQAVQTFRPLHAASPRDTGLSLALARALQALGFFRLRNSEAEPGEAAVRSAIELLEVLEIDHPEIAEHGRRLGRCYDLVGVVGLVRGQSAQYLPYWDKAVAVLERTIARHPEDIEARALVVKALQNRSSGLEGLDNLEAALLSCRQSAEQGRKVRALAPENPTVRYDFASSLDFLAIQELQMGLFQLAERSTSEALEQFQSLAASSPSVAKYRTFIFHSLTHCAQSQVALGHLLHAAATIREARAVMEQMGPLSKLDFFVRQRIAELEQASGNQLAEQRRWLEAIPVIEANVRRREALFSEQRDNWLTVRDLIESKSSLVEARLRAGRISLPEAVAAFTQTLSETEADSRRVHTPTIGAVRAEVLLLLAALHAQAGELATAQSNLEKACAPLEEMTAEHPERLQWRLSLARAVFLRAELHQTANQATQALFNARRAVQLLEPTIIEGSGYLYELGAFQTAWSNLAETVGTTEARTGAPDLQACLATLKKAVANGFDNGAKLRHDPRLNRLRYERKSDFDQLVASVSAASTGAPAAQTKSRSP